MSSKTDDWVGWEVWKQKEPEGSLMDVITETMQINVALLTAGFIGLTVSANREVQRIQNSTLLGAIAFCLLVFSSVSIIITKWQLHANKAKKTSLQKFSVGAMASVALLFSLFGVVSTIVSLGFLVNWKFRPGDTTVTPSPTASDNDSLRFNIVVAIIGVFGGISLLTAIITSVLVWIVKGK